MIIATGYIADHITDHITPLSSYTVPAIPSPPPSLPPSLPPLSRTLHRRKGPISHLPPSFPSPHAGAKADPKDIKTVFKDLDWDIRIRLPGPLYQTLLSQIKARYGFRVKL